jgi:hypothetical protein
LSSWLFVLPFLEHIQPAAISQRYSVEQFSTLAPAGRIEPPILEAMAEVALFAGKIALEKKRPRRRASSEG